MSISPQRKLRPAGQIQRSPSLSEGTELKLFGIGVPVLLVAAGLFLAIGVGGWLAITGGIVLVLAGVAICSLTLYLYKFGNQSQR